MCGQLFTPGDPHLQEWSIRESQRVNDSARCINGGIGADHELHAETPPDKEPLVLVTTMETPSFNWSCQLTPLLIKFPRHLQLMMMFFTLEEAFRLDDGIVKFQWFATITCDVIKKLRGSMYVQTSHTLLRSSTSSRSHLRAIMRHGASTHESGSAWKDLFHSCWLPFRSADNECIRQHLASQLEDYRYRAHQNRPPTSRQTHNRQTTKPQTHLIITNQFPANCGCVLGDS